jgi:hypothetical protein
VFVRKHLHALMKTVILWDVTICCLLVGTNISDKPDASLWKPSQCVYYKTTLQLFSPTQHVLACTSSIITSSYIG